MCGLMGLEPRVASPRIAKRVACLGEGNGARRGRQKVEWCHVRLQEKLQAQPKDPGRVCACFGSSIIIRFHPMATTYSKVPRSYGSTEP